MLNVKVLTIFPEMFPGFLGYSLTGKALEEKKWQIEAINISNAYKVYRMENNCDIFIFSLHR